jgi:hypothetical protein
LPHANKSRVHTRAHTHTRTHTRAHIHTHPHTHTHTAEDKTFELQLHFFGHSEIIHYLSDSL